MLLPALEIFHASSRLDVTAVCLERIDLVSRIEPLRFSRLFLRGGIRANLATSYHSSAYNMHSTQITHAILVSFYPDVSQSTREDALTLFRQLAVNCGGRDAGILYWVADWSLDQRKNYQLMVIGVFENEDALRRYIAHPNHKSFVSILSKLADWVVGDISTDFQVARG